MPSPVTLSALLSSLVMHNVVVLGRREAESVVREPTLVEVHDRKQRVVVDRDIVA